MNENDRLDGRFAAEERYYSPIE